MSGQYPVGFNSPGGGAGGGNMAGGGVFNQPGLNSNAMMQQQQMRQQQMANNNPMMGMGSVNNALVGGGMGNVQNHNSAANYNNPALMQQQQQQMQAQNQMQPMPSPNLQGMLGGGAGVGVGLQSPQLSGGGGGGMNPMLQQQLSAQQQQQQQHHPHPAPSPQMGMHIPNAAAVGMGAPQMGQMNAIMGGGLNDGGATGAAPNANMMGAGPNMQAVAAAAAAAAAAQQQHQQHHQQQQQQQQHQHQQLSQLQLQQQHMMQTQQLQQQQQQQKDFNIVSLCRFGQETVQDILSRFQEVFLSLKAIQPPSTNVSMASNSTNSEKKVTEQFRTIRLLFKRLRLLFDKCNDSSFQDLGIEYTPIESLIPLKDEPDTRPELLYSEEYEKHKQENRELADAVMLKSKQLREIIDRIRIIIWEVNTMLSMRRS